MRYDTWVSSPSACVLDEDTDLAELVPVAQQEAARHASLAPLMVVGSGRWDGRTAADHAPHGFGLLVLDGVLIRRCGVEGRFGAELLGAGDLLRPWDFDGDDALRFDTTWRVLVEARLAVLDDRWSARMARYPRVGPALAGRALMRSRRLTTLMAIAQHPRLDARLWMLFWELADRHGRVGLDGVHVDLPLTHEVLGHLAAARRPSVSGSLTRLASEGRIRREGRGWVLAGEPPHTGP